MKQKPSFVSIFAALLLSAQAVFPQSTPPENWQRMTLTGTGLSIETPQLCKLDQDKPHPWEKEFTAHVRYSLSFRDIYSTFVYEKKPDDKRTPRQRIESTASLFQSTASRITDITYLGEPAALFEEEFVEAQKKLKMRRSMVAFGRPGEITIVNVSYPRENAAVAAIGERIFKSVQKAGAVASETSLYPPINWKRLSLNGLNYETPTLVENPKCGELFLPSDKYELRTVCYKWGDSVMMNLGYRKYLSGTGPLPKTEAENYIKESKITDQQIGLTNQTEYSLTNYGITTAEGAKVRVFTSHGTVGTIEEVFFIRRGAEFWRIMVYHFIERKADELAERIVDSLSFAAAPLVTQPVAPGAADVHFEKGKSLAAAGNHMQAVLQFTDAIRVSPQNGLIYFHRALSYEKVGELDLALADYNNVIKLRLSLREALYNRGTLHLRKKNYAAAITDLSNAIALDVRFDGPYYNRGLAYLNLKDFDRSLADFNRVIELQPRHINSHIMRSRIYCSKGLVMSAIKEQQRVKELGGTIELGCK